MPSVRCPCLNCGFRVYWGQGDYFRKTEKQAMDELLKHIFQDHTVKEIREWVERCLVDYWQKEVGEKQR